MHKHNKQAQAQQASISTKRKNKQGSTSVKRKNMHKEPAQAQQASTSTKGKKKKLLRPERNKDRLVREITEDRTPQHAIPPIHHRPKCHRKNSYIQTIRSNRLVRHIKSTLYQITKRWISAQPPYYRTYPQQRYIKFINHVPHLPVLVSRRALVFTPVIIKTQQHRNCHDHSTTKHPQTQQLAQSEPWNNTGNTDARVESQSQQINVARRSNEAKGTPVQRKSNYQFMNTAPEQY